MNSIETSINETLYRIDEQEGKDYWNGHESNYANIRGNALILNPDDPSDGFHMIYNVDLYTFGEISDDISKDHPEYFMAFRIDDLGIWSVINVNTHIITMYQIEVDKKMYKFSTALYDGMYEENNEIFRKMYRILGSRGHYTPASVRNEKFNFIDKLFQYADFIHPHNPMENNQYINVPARSSDLQIGIVDTVEFGMQFKSLMRIAISKAMRTK